MYHFRVCRQLHIPQGLRPCSYRHTFSAQTFFMLLNIARESIWKLAAQSGERESLYNSTEGSWGFSPVLGFGAWHMYSGVNYLRLYRNRLSKWNLGWPMGNSPGGGGGSTHLWNVGQLQRDYTALHSRRLTSYSPPWEPDILCNQHSSGV
jgi:hypothetical protein